MAEAEFLATLLKAGGVPAVVMGGVFLALMRRRADPHEDPTAEAIDKLGDKIDELSSRMVRVETILEERK